MRYKETCLGCTPTVNQAGTVYRRSITFNIRGKHIGRYARKGQRYKRKATRQLQKGTEKRAVGVRKLVSDQFFQHWANENLIDMLQPTQDLFAGMQTKKPACRAMRKNRHWLMKLSIVTNRRAGPSLTAHLLLWPLLRARVVLLHSQWSLPFPACHSLLSSILLTWQQLAHTTLPPRA